MNTKSFRTLALRPLLFATVAGLALAVSGCVVDSNPNDGYGYGCQSDLVVDWQIQNPAGGSVTCDAISIGLGFEADVIAQPTEIEPLGCPKPDPCDMDAGPSTCDSGAPPMDSGTKDSGAKDSGEKDAEKRDSAKKD